MTTAEIVQAFQQGRDREENFQRLFERYYGQLYRFFQRKKMLPEDCRCLTQAAFISVYKGLEHLRQVEHFESWLLTIAQNGYRNAVERQRAQKRAAQEVSLDGPGGSEEQPVAARIAAPEATPMAILLTKEKKEKLRAAMQELPDQMRRCVQLRVAKDLSYDEIASIMGLATNTVKAHLHQARKALREKLSSYFLDEVDF